MTSPHQYTDGANRVPPVASIPLTEDDPARRADRESIGGLVRDATTHLSTLIRAEMELARAEITAEVKKGLTGSVFFLIAITLLLLLSPFALVTIALVLSIWLPQWAGFAIVTGLMVLLAGGAGYAGWRRVRRIRAPRRTIDTMRDTVRDTTAALKRHGDTDRSPEH